MQDAIIIITSLAAILFTGMISIWLARTLRIPESLLLLIAGICIGRTTIAHARLIDITPTLLNSIAILTLTIIAFDSAIRLHFRDINTTHTKQAKLSITTAIITLILFSAAAYYLLNITISNSILLSAVIIGTQLENFIAPIAIVLPFAILGLQNLAPLSIASNLLISIGTGIFIGIILFKIIKSAHAELYSPLVLTATALLAYVLAEHLGGIGILATVTLGLFLGNVYAKEKIAFLDNLHADFVNIFVFILLGTALTLPLDAQFWVTSGILFAAYTLIRFITAYFSGAKLEFALAPKGITTAVVILALAHMTELGSILNTAFTFLLYSIILNLLASLYENNPHRH